MESVDKNAFYKFLDREYMKCSNHDIKIVIDAQVMPVIVRLGALDLATS